MAPSAAALEAFNIPADIVVAPVYELLPDNVNIPDPDLVIVQAPDMTPLTVPVEPFVSKLSLVVEPEVVKLLATL